MRFVFIHYPKTGGGFIRQHIGQKVDLWIGQELLLNKKLSHSNHYSYNSIKHCLNKNDITFSVVRNPYDVLESRFFFAKENDGRPMWLDQVDSFEQFILEKHFLPKNDPSVQSYYWKVGTQTQLNTGVKNIFRFENYKSELKDFFKKFDISLEIDKLEKINVTKTKNNIEWSSKMLKVVNKYFNEDFANFKYNKRT